MKLGFHFSGIQYKSCWISTSYNYNDCNRGSVRPSVSMRWLTPIRPADVLFVRRYLVRTTAFYTNADDLLGRSRSVVTMNCTCTKVFGVKVDVLFGQRRSFLRRIVLFRCSVWTKTSYLETHEHVVFGRRCSIPRRSIRTKFYSNEIVLRSWRRCPLGALGHEARTWHLSRYPSSVVVIPHPLIRVLRSPWSNFGIFRTLHYLNL